MPTISNSKKQVNGDVAKELQLLESSGIIELYELDPTGIYGLDDQLIPQDILRFHAGTNELMQNVVWRGDTYIALPIESEGFDVSIKGTLPRPRVRIANTVAGFSGLFNPAIIRMYDFIGAKFTRKRTFIKYLDAVNFASGNPNANPNNFLPDDVYFVEQKILENRQIIEWELSSAFDLGSLLLPKRQVRQNSCPWKYRGPDCNYTGDNKFTIKDQPTANQYDDVCSKTLTACKLRFGNAPLPFGGFPGAKRYD